MLLFYLQNLREVFFIVISFTSLKALCSDPDSPKLQQILETTFAALTGILNDLEADRAAEVERREGGEEFFEAEIEPLQSPMSRNLSSTTIFEEEEGEASSDLDEEAEKEREEMNKILGDEFVTRKNKDPYLASNLESISFFATQIFTSSRKGFNLFIS